MSDDILERRYRALLRAYPAGYRHERADEVIDTLIGDEPTTRRWPSPRETAALLRGALRVHGGSTAPRPAAVMIWQGMHLGAMAVLALGVLVGVDDLVEAFEFGGLDQPLVVLRSQGPNLVLLVATLVALAAGRVRAAAGLALAAIVVPTAISQLQFANGVPQWWAPVVAAPMILLALRRPVDVPLVDRGNALLATAAVLALHLIPAGGLDSVALIDQGIVVAMVLIGTAGFLWLATADPRLLIAAAPTFTLGTLQQLTVTTPSAQLIDRPDALPSLFIGVLLVIAAAAWARQKRHVRNLHRT